ncbi:MAG: hypothetical protein ACQEW8_15575, partial [Actinomycetota bacterium]
MADVTGDVTFDTEKRMTPQPGTGNRVVLYPFHISEGVGGARFASSMQELVDELAVGAEVIASSAGPGEWTFEGDASTGITATWNHVGTVLNNGQMPTRAGDVWLRVRYPEAAFPEGTVPPVNTVVLSVEDQAGVRYGALAEDSVQPLEVTSGAPVPQAALTKTMVPGAVSNGQRFRTDLSVYYADGGQDVDAESIALEDVGSVASNAGYFQSTAVQELRFGWNAILQAADVPVRLEVQFDDGTWEVADDTRTTGQGQYRVLFRADGSTAGGGGANALVEFPAGAVLTGWRLVVSPDAGTSVPTGSVANAFLFGYAAYEGEPGGSVDLPNTATVTIPVQDGSTLSDEASDTLTMNDAISVSTSISAPATLVVNVP